MSCIIGGCLSDASGVRSPNIRSLCTLFNQFKFRKPQSDPERASTALRGAVAALNGGRWRRSSPFGISYYALLHGRHRAEYKRRRAEGGGGRGRQRERNGGGQTETARQECTIQFERRSRSGRSPLLSPTVFGPLRRTGPRISVGSLVQVPSYLPTDKLTTT